MRPLKAMHTADPNDIRDCLVSDRERMLAIAHALAREEGGERERFDGDHETPLRQFAGVRRVHRPQRPDED